MKILIFGANGQVGHACLEQATHKDDTVIPLFRKDADLSNPEKVYSTIINAAADIVINTAAYTAVDKAESEPALAKAINTLSPASMAKACQTLSIPFIHLSTDYVFDGTSEQPYIENDQTNPQGVYGQTKRWGEQQVLDNCQQSLILRTSWVFGHHGNNFVKTMLRLGMERDHLSIVSDQTGCPTFASHIAESIFELITLYRKRKGLPWGLYHLADSPMTTWYDFAKEIFKEADSAGLLKHPVKLTPIKTSDFPTEAIRPAYSVLNCHKLENLLERPMKQWRSGLKCLIRSL